MKVFSPTHRFARAARLGVLSLALLAGTAACGDDGTSSGPNPVPVLEAISPPGGNSGSTDFTFIVLGDGFVKSSVVRWAGTDLQTKYVDRGQLRATVPTALLAHPGSYPIAVANPAPGGGISGTISFVLK